MSKIHIFTTFYNEKNEARRQELLTCIKNNLENPSIACLTIFNEGESLMNLSSKIREKIIDKRPTYDDFLKYINMLAKDDDIYIIANTDIYFDQNIAVLKEVMSQNDCYALSRWDTTVGKKPLLYNHNGSQDAWIFRGPIKQALKADFPLGVPRCDNRFLYEIERAGYEVLNPAFSIRAFHIHKGQRAMVYTEDDNIYKIPPPYRYKYPHNLYGFWKTLSFNVSGDYKLASYCYDIKKVNNWWPVRLVRKCLELLTQQKMPLIGYK